MCHILLKRPYQPHGGVVITIELMADLILVILYFIIIIIIIVIII